MYNRATCDNTWFVYMSKRRIFAFAVCYLLLVLVALLVDIQLGLERFDTGGEASRPEQIANFAVSIFLAPADQLWAFIGRERFGPIVQWVMIVGNAALWGILTEAVFSHYHGKRVPVDE